MVGLRDRYAAVSVIIRRRHGCHEYLVQDVEYKDGGVVTKFVGGKEEPEDNGNPQKTIREEVEEETGLRLRDSVEAKILLESVTKRGNPLFFFLLWRGNFKGNIRRDVIHDDRAKLYPPRWITRAELEKQICPTHRPVLDLLPAY